MDDNIRTASAEELREHVKRVGILVLATLVGFLQAFFAMSVVYLLFLLLSHSQHVVSSSLSERQSN